MVNIELTLNGVGAVSKAFMCCVFVERIFLGSKVMIGQCKHLALSKFSLCCTMCLHD